MARRHQPEKVLSQEDALSELWGKENEFLWLQSKMASYPHTIPTFEEVLPIAAAITECQIRIHELKKMLGLP